jgi:lysophospholipase L1-like esterase
MPTSLCDAPDKSWAALAANQRLSDLKRRGFDVLDFENLAVSGSTPGNWLGKAVPATGDKPDLSGQLAGIEAAHPDVVLMTLGANDVLSCLSGQDAALQSLQTAYTPQWLANTETQMTDVFKRLVASLPKNGKVVVVLYYRPPLDAFGAVATINARVLQAAQFDPRIVFVKAPDIAAGQACLPVMQGMLGAEDGCLHPNAAGHQLIANAVQPVLAGTATLRPPTVKSELLGVFDSVTAPTRWLANARQWGLQVSWQLTTLLLDEAAKAGGAGVEAARQAILDFVVNTPRAGASPARVGRTHLVWLRRTVRYRNGVAQLRFVVPRQARRAGTKVYLTLGPLQAGTRNLRPGTRRHRMGTLGVAPRATRAAVATGR